MERRFVDALDAWSLGASCSAKYTSCHWGLLTGGFSLGASLAVAPLARGIDVFDHAKFPRGIAKNPP